MDRNVQNDNDNKNKDNGDGGKGKNRNVIILLALSIVLTLLCWRAYDKITNGTKKEIPYSGFIEMLDGGQVENAEIYSKKIKFTTRDDDGKVDKNTYITVRINDDSLADKLSRAHEKYATTYNGKDESGSAMIGTILSYVVMIGAFYLFLSLITKRGGMMGGFGKSNAKEAPKPFALPEPYGTMRRMYAYLMRQRHIDREVISAFVHEKLLYEDKHHNCVFVGLDGSGEAKHAHIRSTNSEGRVFRMNIESSASEHCFHKNGTDKSLYVFEAPIDLLSHITLYPYGWQEHSYVACCGTSIQPVLEMLRQNPKLDTVYLCLDNDDAGNDACDRMTDTLEDMGLEVERLCPVRKDWNDDLRAKFERKENLP